MNLTELAVKTVYWFFLYGFIGWGVEVVYAAVKTHALVNRGFLCGPICPISGFGMVGLIYSVSLIPMPDSGSMSAVAIFFIGIFLMGLPPVYLQTLPLIIRPLLGNGLLIGVLLAVAMENLIPWDRIKS